MPAQTATARPQATPGRVDRCPNQLNKTAQIGKRFKRGQYAIGRLVATAAAFAIVRNYLGRGAASDQPALNRSGRPVG